jgi:hypothetical protein
MTKDASSSVALCPNVPCSVIPYSVIPYSVIPAKAGIQGMAGRAGWQYDALDSRLRGNDEGRSLFGRALFGRFLFRHSLFRHSREGGNPGDVAGLAPAPQRPSRPAILSRTRSGGKYLTPGLQRSC